MVKMPWQRVMSLSICFFQLIGNVKNVGHVNPVPFAVVSHTMLGNGTQGGGSMSACHKLLRAIQLVHKKSIQYRLCSRG